MKWTVTSFPIYPILKNTHFWQRHVNISRCQMWSCFTMGGLRGSTCILKFSDQTGIILTRLEHRLKNVGWGLSVFFFAIYFMCQNAYFPLFGPKIHFFSISLILLKKSSKKSRVGRGGRGRTGCLNTKLLFLHVISFRSSRVWRRLRQKKRHFPIDPHCKISSL